MAETNPDEQSTPEEVFGTLADDTRVAILQSLWADLDVPASFSELREGAGVADSGQFNYHLDKLVGTFVKKAYEGYTLSQAGKQICGAIESGAYTMDWRIEPFPIDDPCPACGGVRQFGYEDEVVRVSCDSCPLHYEFVVPPGVFIGYDHEQIPSVASRYLQTNYQQIQRGFCWLCQGQTRPTVGPAAELAGTISELDELPGEWSQYPLVRYDCERCRHTSTAGLEFALLSHPAVAGFHYEHGIDVREKPLWEQTWMRPDRAELRSREPLRARASFEAGGETLAVTVDDEFEVLEIERR